MTRTLYRTAFASALGCALALPALGQDADATGQDSSATGQDAAPNGLTPRAYLQVWGTLYDMDVDPQADPAGYGDPEHDPGVLVQRGRLGFDGRHDWLDYRVTVGMGAAPDALFPQESNAGLVDAYLRGTFAAGPGDLRVGFGAQKVPVSRELLMSSSDLLFQERSVGVNHLMNTRDAGLLVDWQGDFGGRARVGVFNGNSSFLGDDNLGVLAAGRLEYATGDTYTTVDDDTAVGVAVSGQYNADVATREMLVGADTLIRFGPLTALVEGTMSQLEPVRTDVAPPEVQAKTTRLGAHAQLSALLPLERGDLEIGARGALFDDDTDARDNGDVLIVHGGASWRDVLPGLDLGAGYVHRTELGGRTIPNDTVRLWTQVVFPARER